MKTLLLLALLLTPFSAYAWNHEGHRTVAAIAYDNLEDDERRKINEILKYHPFYEEYWRVAYKTYKKNNPSAMEFEKYAFIRAAGWPDDVRSDDFKDEYHNATWHYVNFPATPPNSLDTDEPIGTGILLDQIAECNKVISSRTSRRQRENRAIMLAWLLHLVGDLHQPLHAVALVNDTYPEGDHGGNDFFVRGSRGAKPTTLHSYWDGLLGNSMDIADAVVLAKDLQREFPKKNEMLRGDFNAWAKESAKLGLNNAYQFKGQAIRGKTKKYKAQAPTLPSGYRGASRDIAIEQVAHAGYRLAGMLSKLVD